MAPQADSIYARAVQPKYTQKEHGPFRSMWRALAYNLRTYVARRPDLTADLPWLGVRLRAGSEDMLARRLYKTATYERAVTEFVLGYLTLAEPAPVFDVGANVGYYSVLAHRVLGDGVPIHAFEAEPSNFAQLQHNLADAKARSVVAHHRAVSDEPGEVELFLWKRSNRGKHSIVPFTEADDAGGDSVRVLADTLDAFWAGAAGSGQNSSETGELSLLKIDIEGAEHRAFLGARDLLPRCRVILSEVSNKFLARAGVSLDEHLALVLDRGFSLFEIRDDGRAHPTSADELRTARRGCNVIYVRDDQRRAPWFAQLAVSATSN
ncbi:MAG: FkbM family methyltransferase [Planctomycetota bacterium]